MGIAFLVIGLVILAASVGVFVKFVGGYVRDKKINNLSKKVCYAWGGAVLGFAAAGGFIQGAINALQKWNITAGHASMAILGQIFFFMFFAIISSCFYVRYWKPTTQEKALKWIKIGMFGSIPLLIIFGFLAIEGMTPYLDAPYVSGFLIDGNGFHLTYAGKLIKNKAGEFEEFSGGFHVAWYGVLIVFGALVCYWISDHRFYKEFHKHGIVDNILLLAFPAGIIGARIWYVVGNWEKDGFNTNFASVFRIWDGGLTILGGAVAGIVVGVLYMILRKKYVDIRFAMDVIIPTILIAQAIGRWGNFFNSEVFGKAVFLHQGWDWIPNFITKNMGFIGNLGQYSGQVYDATGTVALTSYSFALAGQIVVPLFFIEGLLNIAGYFIIVYGIPKIWKNYALGLKSGAYLVWYGVVRAILENFRNPAFNMGNKGIWSNINAYIYIAIGAALIIGFCIFNYWLKKHGKPHCFNRMPEEKKKKKVMVKKVIIKKNAQGEIISRTETYVEKDAAEVSSVKKSEPAIKEEPKEESKVEDNTVEGEANG